MHRRIARKARSVRVYVNACAMLGGTVLMLVVLATSGHAESALRQSSSSRAKLSASANLDIRVTVQPSMGLTTQGNDLRVRGNCGALNIQRGTVRLATSGPPDAGAKLPAAIDGEMITIAAP
jgi:hypothetical protein